MGCWGTWNWGQRSELPDKLSEFADYYNVIVASFLSVNDQNVVAFADPVNETYFQDAVNQIHLKGAIMLASTGGENNTWHATLETSEDTRKLAENIVNYLIDYNLDGIDFNLKSSDKIGTDDRISNMKKTIDRIRTIANTNQEKFPRGFFITASPQTYVPNGTQGSIFWIPGTGNKKFQPMLHDYKEKQTRFDALIIHNFQNVHSEVRTNQPPTLCMQIASKFLANARDTDTKIVIGVLLDPSFKSYVTLAELQEAYEKEDDQGKALKSYNNFGGIMVWSILGEDPTKVDSLEFGRQVRNFYPKK